MLPFPFEIEFYAVANQGIGLYSQNVYQNQRVLCNSIYIEPVLASREECNAFEELLFLKVIFAFGEIFINKLMSFCSSIYIEDSPKLP